MKQKQALQLELTACRIGVRLCSLLSIFSFIAQEWMALVASMLTMMVCEVAKHLVERQIDEAG
jgi:diacylglycerol kinase